MRQTLNISFVVLLLSAVSSYAQDSLSASFKEKKIAFVVLPLVASAPANGFMFGISGTAGWYLGDKTTTTLSDVIAAAIYTTKKQSINFIKSDIFLRDDQWVLKGDWRIFFSTAETFGLGSGPPEVKPIPYEQQVDFNFFRIHETALKRFRDSRFFAGIGYHFDSHYSIEDKFNEPVPDSTLQTSNDFYSETNGFNPTHYLLSGISLNALYDSRDNPVFPLRGHYALASFRINETFLGSDKNSTMLWLEYRDYFRLSKTKPRHLIALWTYANLVTSGAVPYLDLPAVGWDQYGRSARGYKQGQIRGYDLVYGELEWRFPFPVIFHRWPDLLGGVLFANASTANDPDAGIGLFEYVDPAVGLGLRVMLSKKSKTNVTLDFAIGKYQSTGFYLDFNEAF